MITVTMSMEEYQKLKEYKWALNEILSDLKQWIIENPEPRTEDRKKNWNRLSGVVNKEYFDECLTELEYNQKCISFIHSCVMDEYEYLLSTHQDS